MITGTLVIFLLCSPSVAILVKRLELTSPVTGPESLAFDLYVYGEGPNGKIYKYGPNEGFVKYASTSPYRNKTMCDGIAAQVISIDFLQCC
ncbi:hypothetical protein TSUD_18250 [Trifolium subterraneum]|uniref:Uncharacterized protein n=1 Tax=Trifolium subterraneum TaxID=3900 RepID=A0A2Z6N407_TRISU|nr:hypothetical protein TSUD_18250 [Trifolium subterraneum]